MSDPNQVKVEVNDGKVTFYLDDFWHAFNDEQKRDIFNQLVWEKEVFCDLIDAIVNDKIVTDRFKVAIYDVRQRLLESLGIIEKNHFRSLLHEFEQAKLDGERWEKSYWKLWRSLPADYRDKWGKDEPYKGSELASDEKVETEMKAREKLTGE